MTDYDRRLVSFQARSGHEGRRFEAEARTVLTTYGFRVEPGSLTVNCLGFQVDLVATNPKGVTFWVECKGGVDRDPGLERGDNVRKALCNVLLAHIQGGHPPFVILTTAYPKPRSRNAVMLDAAVRCGALLDYMTPADHGRLSDLAHLEAR